MVTAEVETRCNPEHAVCRLVTVVLIALTSRHLFVKRSRLVAKPLKDLVFYLAQPSQPPASLKGRRRRQSYLFLLLPVSASAVNCPLSMTIRPNPQHGPLAETEEV